MKTVIGTFLIAGALVVTAPSIASARHSRHHHAHDKSEHSEGTHNGSGATEDLNAKSLEAARGNVNSPVTAPTQAPVPAAAGTGEVAPPVSVPAAPTGN